jgi:hypothetical protein
MEAMYSPIENINKMVRMGHNKKIHVIKGTRYIKREESENKLNRNVK